MRPRDATRTSVPDRLRLPYLPDLFCTVVSIPTYSYNVAQDAAPARSGPSPSSSRLLIVPNRITQNHHALRQVLLQVLQVLVGHPLLHSPLRKAQLAAGIGDDCAAEARP